MGLFGNSKQEIYSEWIGYVQSYIFNNDFNLVQENDSYRCSPQVIRVANSFRCDGLEQEIALKVKDGVNEIMESREGSAMLYFAMAPEKVPLKGERKTKTKSCYKAVCVELRDRLLDAVKKGIQISLV